MPFDLLQHLSLPPASMQPLILAGLGLLLLACLQRSRGVKVAGPRPRSARWANRKDLRPPTHSS